MHDKKWFLSVVTLVYLLGALTAFLVLCGLSWAAGGEAAGPVGLGAVAALLVITGVLGVALWRLARGDGPQRWGLGNGAASGADGGSVRGASPTSHPPAFRRAVDDLPTVTDYYRNAADGVLPPPSPGHRDLDPASDPAYAPEPKAGAVGA